MRQSSGGCQVPRRRAPIRRRLQQYLYAAPDIFILALALLPLRSSARSVAVELVVLVVLVLVVVIIR